MYAWERDGTRIDRTVRGGIAIQLGMEHCYTARLGGTLDPRLSSVSDVVV
jgi:hypothetical protein